MDKRIKIFSGTSGCKLAEKVSEILEIPLGKSKILKFKDGEYYAKIDESVRGADVFVVQSTSTPVNENIMGLLIFIDALKRASANTINLVIPYYGYARQDRKASPREPISSKLIADLLVTAGADRMITMDLHSSQIQGFFDIPVDHLEGMPVIAKHFVKEGFSGEETVVVAPSASGVKRARKLSEYLDCTIGIIDRRYSAMDPNKIESVEIIGNIEGKRVVFIDGFIDTATTVLSATKAVLEKGASEVHIACTHGIFSEGALEKIEKSSVSTLIATDTIKINNKIDKLKVLSVDELFSETLKRIMRNQSIESLIE